MWIARLLYAMALSLLPRRWRPARLPVEFTPWVPAAILSGILEAMLAVVGLTYWYSHTVTRWAAHALDSGLNNGPTADIDPHVLGLTVFVIWCLHPLTWLVAGFFIEGLVRIVAARPYPFVYRLRRLAAGVPGRNVLQYEPPVQLQENRDR